MEKIENKVSLAWKLILEQYIEKAKESSRQEGAGLNMFRMLTNFTPEGSNCEYFYTCKDDPAFKRIMLYTPESEKLLEKYNPNTMFLIGVHISQEDNPFDTIGNIRIFEFETNKEVNYLE